MAKTLSFCLCVFIMACNGPRQADSGKECIDTTTPAAVSWMKEPIEQFRPAQILKFSFKQGEWAYLFTGKNVYLYDCRGKMICQSTGPSEEKCRQLLPPDDIGVIVWQDEGMHE
jgi:hypothetical protein